MRKKYYAVMNVGVVRMEHAKDEDEAQRLAFGMVSPRTKVYDLGTNKVEAYKRLVELGLGEM